ncbi:MAG: hypothetical protein EPO02_13285 [Nitrospirae bacterium]|nr:MAG: hypothetical protein EPO02_13285 [Nitrospirota bacterium]
MDVLYITEFGNYGDVQWETPVAPATETHRVPIEDHVEISASIAADTRLVVLFATAKCMVALIPDGVMPDDVEPGRVVYFPVAAETETVRLMHTNVKFRVAVMAR